MLTCQPDKSAVDGFGGGNAGGSRSSSRLAIGEKTAAARSRPLPTAPRPRTRAHRLGAWAPAGRPFHLGSGVSASPSAPRARASCACWPACIGWWASAWATAAPAASSGPGGCGSGYSFWAIPRVRCGPHNAGSGLSQWRPIYVQVLCEFVNVPWLLGIDVVRMWSTSAARPGSADAVGTYERNEQSRPPAGGTSTAQWREAAKTAGSTRAPPRWIPGGRCVRACPTRRVPRAGWSTRSGTARHRPAPRLRLGIAASPIIAR